MFIKELLRGHLNVHVLSIQTLKLKKFYFHIPFSMGWNVIKVKIKWFPYVTETIWGFPGLLTVGHLTDLIVGDKAKGRFSKRRQPESKASQIFRTCAYQEVRNVYFSENLTCFVFLLLLRFGLSPYHRRNEDREMFIVQLKEANLGLRQTSRLELFVNIVNNS